MTSRRSAPRPAIPRPVRRDCAVLGAGRRSVPASPGPPRVPRRADQRPVLRRRDGAAPPGDEEQSHRGDKSIAVFSQTRNNVLDRFRRKIAAGLPLIDGGAGTGLSARRAEAGGIERLPTEPAIVARVRSIAARRPSSLRDVGPRVSLSPPGARGPPRTRPTTRCPGGRGQFPGPRRKGPAPARGSGS